MKIYTTGGSIDKYYRTQDSDFVVGQPKAATILSDANVSLEVEFELLFQKDSLQITEDDRQMIYEKIKGDNHSRIVITHGTDTMIQTAQGLGDIPGKVIVLTGAMQPADFKHSDAQFNLGGAIIAAQTLPAGVYLVMNGRVFSPWNVWKNLAEDRFEELPG